MNLYKFIQNFFKKIINLDVQPFQVELQEGFLLPFLVQQIYPGVFIPEHPNKYLKTLYAIQLLKENNFEQLLLPSQSQLQNSNCSLFIYRLVELFFKQKFLKQVNFSTIQTHLQVLKNQCCINFINIFSKDYIYSLESHTIQFYYKQGMVQSDQCITRKQLNQFQIENNQVLLFNSDCQEEVTEFLDDQNLWLNSNLNYSFLLLFEFLSLLDLFKVSQDIQISVQNRNKEIQYKYKPII